MEERIKHGRNLSMWAGLLLIILAAGTVFLSAYTGHSRGSGGTAVYESAALVPTACYELNPILYRGNEYIYAGWIEKAEDLELWEEEMDTFTGAIVNEFSREPVKVTPYRFTGQDNLIVLENDGFYTLYQRLQ